VSKSHVSRPDRCAWCDRAVTDLSRAVALHASDGGTLWACDVGGLAGVIADLAGLPGLTLDATLPAEGYPP
jgi:hypothetical protein